MKRVTGIGGIFFKAKDPIALRACGDGPGGQQGRTLAAAGRKLVPPLVAG